MPGVASNARPASNPGTTSNFVQLVQVLPDVTALTLGATLLIRPGSSAAVKKIGR